MRVFAKMNHVGYGAFFVKVDIYFHFAAFLLFDMALISG